LGQALKGAIDEVVATLRVWLEQLAAERPTLLPDDATDVRHGGGPESVWDDSRYRSSARATTGSCRSAGARRSVWS